MRIEVQLASSADIRVKYSSPGEAALVGGAITIGSPLAGLGAGPAGMAVALMMGPLYAIVGPPVAAVHQHDAKVIRQAFADEPLDGLLKEVLRRDLASGAADPAPFVLKAALNYGLGAVGDLTKEQAKIKPFFDKMGYLCLVVASRVTLEHRGAPVREFDLLLGTDAADSDIPPPICAPLSRFADNNAAYLRAAVQEAAEVLAVLVRLRLQAP